MMMMMMTMTTVLHAQNKEAMKKIESARIALITQRLGLTPVQAQQFWPLYNEYALQKRDLRKQFVEERSKMDPQNITEQESRRLMELNLDIKQKEVNLEREYAGRMMNVISSRQIMSLKQAEQDFNRMLLQRIEQRRRQQMNMERIRQRQEYQRKQGNN